jgi:hypothetical protein
MFAVAVVILAGVVVVASGRGGEMAATSPDYPPLDLGPVTAADVALLRPPSAAWGYNMRVTDEALEVIAKAVTERDVEIAALQQEVSDLRDQLGGGGRPTTREPAGDGGGAERAGPETPEVPEVPAVPEPAWPSDAEVTAASAAVPITRPQPIYHDPGGYGEESGQSTEEVQFGRRDWSDGEGAADQSVQSDQSGQSGQSDHSGESGHGGHSAESSQSTQGSQNTQSSQSTQGEPAAPAGPSAPWEPAPPPGQAPLWEPPHPPTAEHAISWEAAGPATGEQPRDEPASGWSADPADTSPDATALDWSAAPAPDETAAPAPAPAVGREPPASGSERAKPARARGDQEFNWDKDPHQQLVWGPADAQAKTARAAEETLPNSERGEDGRG